jgi:hypothetical protein
MKRLTLTAKTPAELEALHDEQLAHGRAMVPAVEGLELEDVCELEIRCGTRSMKLEVIVRWIPPAPDQPIGVEIDGFDADLKDRLARFVEHAKTSNTARHEQRTRSLVHQFKGLPLVKLMQLAKTGEYNERVALERMYGKSVWEALLRNPKITTPEVARIARKGTVPRTILERVVENQSWVRNAAVRRALLRNPKLGSDALMSILRTMPAAELRQIPQQRVYSLQVRQMAKKLITRG